MARMSSTLDLNTSGRSFPLAMPIWLVKNATYRRTATGIPTTNTISAPVERLFGGKDVIFKSSSDLVAFLQQARQSGLNLRKQDPEIQFNSHSVVIYWLQRNDTLLKSQSQQTYFQSSGAVGKTLPDFVVMMQPSISKPAT